MTDPAVREAMGELYRDAWNHLTETVYAGVDRTSDPQTRRITGSAQWLADNFGSVPLVVLPFTRNDPTGASIYPAAWSLMLAARGQGVGTTLTTVLGMFHGAELGELLGVPAGRGWVNAAAITCGYPLGKWDVADRRPVHEVVYQDRWGEAPGWTVDRPLWAPEPA